MFMTLSARHENKPSISLGGEQKSSLLLRRTACQQSCGTRHSRPKRPRNSGGGTSLVLALPFLFLRLSHHSAPPHGDGRQHVCRHHRGTTSTERLTMSMTPIGCCRPRRHSCHTSAHLHVHLQEEGSLRTREDNVTHKHTATHRTHTNTQHL